MTTTTRIDHPPGVPLPLKGDTLPDSVHIFHPDEILAIEAAVATKRPLLLRGKPGTGKSQLARAAAHALKRMFVHQTVDHRTEVRDLQYRIDAVARLASAQLATLWKDHKPPKGTRDPRELGPFIQPGALWWGFNWTRAATQKATAQGSPSHWVQPPGARPENGAVVLIDEIDKADPAVPDGLLDALGHRGFDVPTLNRVEITGEGPLIILTTNETRALSPAFVRRCLVLRLALPTDRQRLIDHLVARGQAHHSGVDDALLKEAAGWLADDREELRQRRLTPPGVAEYLDLIGALVALRGRHPEAQLVRRLRRMTTRKQLAETDELVDPGVIAQGSEE